MLKEGYKKTEVGVIPEDWEVCLLSEISEINPRKELLDDDELVSFIPMEQVSNGGRILNIEKKKYESVSKGYTPFKNNDVLLAKITPCFENGKRALVKELDTKAGFGSTEFHVLRSNRKSLPEYLYYCISAHRFRELAQLNMTGSAGQKRVPTIFIKEYKLPVPPLREQEKIAEILSTVDCQIDDTEKLIEKCRVLKKGLMQRLLTKGIGHSEFKKSEVGEIPVGWGVKTIGEICELINGRAFKPQEWREDGIPIIRIQNLNGSEDFNYYEGDIDSKYLVSKDDLLFSWSGSRGTSFGPHIWKGINGVLNQHIFKVILKDDTDIEKNFFYYNLKYITEKIEKEAHGSAGLVHITKGALEKIKLVVPELEEQIKISQILYSLDNELQINIRKRKQLESLKKGLMQQLLTGKIRTL